jgi:hypothetical protein
VATAAPVDTDDGSGGAPDTTINPDEDTFGGVDEGFDTMALNGSADDGASDLDADTPEAGEGDVADGNGGYGTGELALDDLADLADDGGLDAEGLDGGDVVAFGVGSEGAEGGGEAIAEATADDGAPFLDDGAEAFALDDLDEAGGLVDDGFDDTPGYDDGGIELGQAGTDGAPLDDADDGPADDPSFDDVGSF